MYGNPGIENLSHDRYGKDNMELRPITKKDYRYMKWIYMGAFPPEERAPFRYVRRRAEQGKADFLGVYVRERLCGFAYLVSYKEIVYFFYFAVDPRVRGRGIGTKVLRELLRRYAGKRFFLALEPLDPKAENYEERVRRHRLYRSVGLVDLPRQLTEAGVIYDLMGVGGEILPEEYRELMDYHMGARMRKALHMQLIEN